MTCVHLRKLFQLCHEQDLRLVVSGSDLVRFVCQQCGAQEVCPSMLTAEYEARDEKRAPPHPPGGETQPAGGSESAPRAAAEQPAASERGAAGQASHPIRR